MPTTDLDERQMKAMVALVEAQAEQLTVLREAVESLEARVALRSELDIIVAQELRTPLAVVTDSLAELKMLKPGDPDFNDVVERASINSNYLNDIVEELLRPWRGEGPVFDRRHLETVILTRIIEQAKKAFVASGDAERITIEGDTGIAVHTSPPRLMGIVINVLQHAVAHCSGSIRLSVQRTDDGQVQIGVSGEGSVLDAEPEAYFQPFGSDLSSEKPSRGIGLYLVRMLTRSLGGDIILSQTPQGETQVTIQLPQRRTEDGDPSATEDSQDH